MRARSRDLVKISAEGSTQCFLLLVRGEALGLFIPRTKTDEAGKTSPRRTRTRTCRSRVYIFRSRCRVFPAGEGFNDHAAPSPPPSQTAYLRRQRGHFYPSPPAAFGTPRAHSAPPLPPLHFATDYFGRVERIHYASVQFADFRDRRVGKG